MGTKGEYFPVYRIQYLPQYSSIKSMLSIEYLSLKCGSKYLYIHVPVHDT